MLSCGLVEQARHEHISDEYKTDILLFCCCSPHLESNRQTRDTTGGSQNNELIKGGSQANKHWPSDYVLYDETTEIIIGPYWS